MVICLERGADCLHMVQLMPLHPKTLHHKTLHISGTAISVIACNCMCFLRSVSLCIFQRRWFYAGSIQRHCFLRLPFAHCDTFLFMIIPWVMRQQKWHQFSRQAFDVLLHLACIYATNRINTVQTNAALSFSISCQSFCRTLIVKVAWISRCIAFI